MRHRLIALVVALHLLIAGAWVIWGATFRSRRESRFASFVRVRLPALRATVKHFRFCLLGSEVASKHTLRDKISVAFLTRKGFAAKAEACVKHLRSGIGGLWPPELWRDRRLALLRKSLNRKLFLSDRSTSLMGEFTSAPLCRYLVSITGGLAELATLAGAQPDPLPNCLLTVRHNAPLHLPPPLGPSLAKWANSGERRLSGLQVLYTLRPISFRYVHFVTHDGRTWELTRFPRRNVDPPILVRDNPETRFAVFKTKKGYWASWYYDQHCVSPICQRSRITVLDPTKRTLSIHRRSAEGWKQGYEFDPWVIPRRLFGTAKRLVLLARAEDHFIGSVSTDGGKTYGANLRLDRVVGKRRLAGLTAAGTLWLAQLDKKSASPRLLLAALKRGSKFSIRQQLPIDKSSLADLNKVTRCSSGESVWLNLNGALLLASPDGIRWRVAYSAKKDQRFSSSMHCTGNRVWLFSAESGSTRLTSCGLSGICAVLNLPFRTESVAGGPGGSIALVSRHLAGMVVRRLERGVLTRADWFLSPMGPSPQEQLNYWRIDNKWIKL